MFAVTPVPRTGGSLEMHSRRSVRRLREHTFVMSRTLAEFLGVKGMRLSGLGDRAISRRTGIPYGTLRYWRTLNRPPRTCFHRELLLSARRPPDPPAYAYLLALYLGDGCLATPGRFSVQLVINLDARYLSIVSQAEAAMRRTMPGLHVGRCRALGTFKVYASSPAWLAPFPQHGPGRKHKRKIELTAWQLEDSVALLDSFVGPKC